MKVGITVALVTGVLGAGVQPLHAQQQQAPPAARITLQEAKTAVDAAEAEARRNGWNLAFVIADAEGTPIYVRRMDGVPKRNYDVAMNKVATAIKTGMNTGDYAAAVRAGTMQQIEGSFLFDGGLLLRRGDQVVGAFSASGASGAQDAQAVRAGMAAIGLQAGGASASPTTPAAPTSTARVQVPTEVLDRYVGEYVVETGEVVVTVTRNGDKLFGQPTGQDQPVELVPVSHTHFRVGGGSMEVEFTIDEAGVVHKILRQNGQEDRARRRTDG